MNASAHSPASYLDNPVWIALSCYSIGPDDVPLSFKARLARENGWHSKQAERIIEEYRRFAFLAATVGHAVTPSDAVDQVWHLHLTYSRDYWECFCPTVLGRALHHGPTAGGDIELDRYFEQYADTLKSYEAVFGEVAPSDVWPKASKRLLDDPRARRVHPRDGVLISYRTLAVMSAAAIAVVGLFVFAWSIVFQQGG